MLGREVAQRLALRQTDLERLVSAASAPRACSAMKITKKAANNARARARRLLVSGRSFMSSDTLCLNLPATLLSVFAVGG